MDIQKRMDELINRIEYHNKKYYIEDTPEISDYEFDMLLRELEKLENDYPEYKRDNSPTMRVGGRAVEEFGEVIHEVQMGSLQDVFSYEEAEEFYNKVCSAVKNPKFTVEQKIDGLSVAVEYRGGKLFRAATRGDGFVGEDITHNIVTINTIPLMIDTDVENLTIRGEVFMPKKSFERLNCEREKKDESLFANPRNAAAGSLRQLDPKIAAKRNLDIFVFNIQSCSDEKIMNLSHSESLKFLKKLGFKTVESSSVITSIEEIISEIKKIGEVRGSLGYDIDGAVIKVESVDHQRILGETSKFPKWAVAFKYPPEQKKTRLLDIVLKVGRTGAVTPNAVLESVSLSGSVISRATLHNKDYIWEKDIRIGDNVIIQKAGDIIPAVISAVKQDRTGNERIFEMPDFCPSCGSRLYNEEDEAVVRCINGECPAQLIRNVMHYASKSAMNIDGLGEKVVKQLCEKDLIHSAADLYNLKKEDLTGLEKFAEKSSENLIKAIEKSKSNPLSKFVYALGIRNIGQKASKLLAIKFKTIDGIMSAKIEEIESIKDFGKIMAQSVTDYFGLDKSREYIQHFKNAGLLLKEEMPSEINEKIKDKIFVLTGTLKSFKRSQASEMIEKAGGKVTSSVSGKTDYVLAGEKAGSKLDKAESLGIKILSEEEFMQMFK